VSVQTVSSNQKEETSLDYACFISRTRCLISPTRCLPDCVFARLKRGRTIFAIPIESSFDAHGAPHAPRAMSTTNYGSGASCH
jgi:hypothetical protein